MPENEERTEQATPRRRQKAREKGQIARSRELTAMAAMAGTLLAFFFAGTAFINRISSLTSGLLGQSCGRDPLKAVKFASIEMMKLMAPFFLTATAFSLIAAAAQGGFLVKPLSIELERLNPLSGLKRLFSFTGLGELLKSLFKFFVGGVLFYYAMKKAVFTLPFTAALDLAQIMDVSSRMVVQAVMYAFITFFIIAALDYLLERWRFERSIRMTKEEMREEHRETEGDPLIKSRVKSVQREMARRRMMQEVPKAAVVVTNPTHIAVALAYEKNEMSAPKVVARGAGFIAEKIRDAARMHGVPIVEDKPLARALYKLALGSFIPEELYRAVAKILAYIYKLKGKAA